MGFGLCGVTACRSDFFMQPFFGAYSSIAQFCSAQLMMMIGWLTPTIHPPIDPTRQHTTGIALVMPTAPGADGLAGKEISVCLHKRSIRKLQTAEFQVGGVFERRCRMDGGWSGRDGLTAPCDRLSQRWTCLYAPPCSVRARRVFFLLPFIDKTPCWTHNKQQARVHCHAPSATDAVAAEPTQQRKQPAAAGKPPRHPKGGSAAAVEGESKQGEAMTEAHP